MLQGRKILLIISGGIAAYKSLELIRLIRKNEGDVRCILTQGGAQFVTPLSVSALSEHKVYSDLWSLTDEAEMGHIRLSRESDLIVVAPASADLIAKMAHGMADDLASTTLLAANVPIMISPAMNPQMWENPAVQENINALRKRGVLICAPAEGDMACGETGVGRMREASELLDSISSFFFDRPLKGFKALVTSGPTYEPIDPVRFLGNRSSGKQGHAIAGALRDLGADVTLVSGPVALGDPFGVKTIHIETAQQMHDACAAALPCDIAVCAAAVSDWRTASISGQKIKKGADTASPTLVLTENPDILKMLAEPGKSRPTLVVGFAAETNDLIKHAQGKLARKGCDMIVANLVGPNKEGLEKTFGAADNHVYLVEKDQISEWEPAPKHLVARKLAEVIAERIGAS
ncbi:MAG: bifunctional phosphopantothenoylcysteine decarboxylase/phosphopantothenate--cysteine ligase CoaBC [Alphaproteobacteria bacterium]|nr:bifunctional phosphopantothenoylcysteine decarboxylase/phosphopantothenate--cysteine ligase CoaBC [Alphaproteobacteria bacterium]